MVVLTKSSSKGSTKIQQIIYNDHGAHIKSRAAYLLLREKMKDQDEDFLEKTDTLWDWLKFREEYLLKEKEKRNGVLFCDYCGKSHLEIGGMTRRELELNNRNPNLATIDHIIPKAEDGPKYDKTNLCVSCRSFNRKKGNKSLEEYLLSMSYENLLKVSPELLKKVAKFVKMATSFHDQLESLLRNSEAAQLIKSKNGGKFPANKIDTRGKTVPGYILFLNNVEYMKNYALFAQINVIYSHIFKVVEKEEKREAEVILAKSPYFIVQKFESNFRQKKFNECKLFLNTVKIKLVKRGLMKQNNKDKFGK